MKHNREFEIAFVGLKPGEHNYDFTVTDSFFETFEKPEFWNANIDVKIILDKKANALLLKFYINGKAIVSCDRCAEDLELTLWDEFELLVNIIDDELVAKKNENDAEVAYIGKSESILDITSWIFEFITLCLPIQRVHGDDQNGKSYCNPTVIDFLENQNKNATNPIWDKLKNNN
jgi:uncharacterized metal-binding protein YceD (DUF177 family)